MLMKEGGAGKLNCVKDEGIIRGKRPYKRAYIAALQPLLRRRRNPRDGSFYLVDCASWIAAATFKFILFNRYSKVNMKVRLGK